MVTKKHNIDILVASDNINILNVIDQLSPSINDPRLWNVEYNIDIRSYNDIDPITFEGANVLEAHICFEDITERNNVIVALRASQGLFNQCREGSCIREVLSDHQYHISERTGSQRVKQYGRDSSGKGPDSKGIYIEDFINNVSQGRVY